MALSKEQVDQYREQGFLLLENVVDNDLLDELRETIDRSAEQSRQVTGSNHMYDLDPSHTVEAPRARRLKDPRVRVGVLKRLAESDAIVDAVDAFLIFETFDLEEFDSRILRGEPGREGRMETSPFRLHLPKNPGADSICDNQAVRKMREPLVTQLLPR